MSNDFYFSTVKFGGFDKEEVLYKLRELVVEYDAEIHDYKERLRTIDERNMYTQQRLSQLEQSCLSLKDKNTRLVDYSDSLARRYNEKETQYQMLLQKYNELERQLSIKDDYNERLIAETQSKCNKMIADARSTAQTIINSAIDDRDVAAKRLEEEYTKRYNILKELARDYESFHEYINQSYNSLKDFMDKLPSDNVRNE